MSTVRVLLKMSVTPDAALRLEHKIFASLAYAGVRNTVTVYTWISEHRGVIFRPHPLTILLCIQCTLSKTNNTID
jgi:hypothetical protein